MKAKKYIEQLMRNESENIDFHKEEILGDTVILKAKASRILVDGNQTGYFVLCSYNPEGVTSSLHYYVEFVPLVNGIQWKEGKIGTFSLKR